jgi:hypothetical protein
MEENIKPFLQLCFKLPFVSALYDQVRIQNDFGKDAEKNTKKNEEFSNSTHYVKFKDNFTKDESLLKVFNQSNDEFYALMMPIHKSSLSCHEISLYYACEYFSLSGFVHFYKCKNFKNNVLVLIIKLHLELLSIILHAFFS